MFLVQLRKRWGHYIEICWTDNLDQAHQIGKKEVLKFLAENDFNPREEKLVSYLIVWLAPGGLIKYVAAKDNPWDWSDRTAKNSIGIDNSDRKHNHESDRVRNKPGSNPPSDTPSN